MTFKRLASAKRFGLSMLLLATAMIGLLEPSPATAALSTWVYPGPNGRLISQPDALGNHIIDESGVGYMGGTIPLPNVPVVMTISPVPGDNTANLQGALDQMAALPLGANGFRGTLLLTAGYYAISNTVSINASGIVLRGVGNDTNGTVIFSTSTNGPDNGPLKSQVQGVIVISGSYSPTPTGVSNSIVDAYVPVGARSFMVDNASGYSVGDNIIVHRPSTASWITAIGMDQLNTPWTPGTVDVDSERVITRIEGNRIMIDQSITTAIDQNFGGGGIYKFVWPQRFNNIGLENLRGQSTYNVNNTNDEDHAWVFIRFSNTENCWVRNVISQYFGKSCVSVQTGVKHATIVNCQCLDPISIILSERRYAFDLNSCQLCLVQNCFTRQDRHSFITQSLTDGPNVFVDGLAQQAYDKAGPHVMWASGLLYDNITTDNGIVCANNGNAGAAGNPGQGWTGANCAFWNCAAGSSTSGFDIEAAPTTHNWLIGGLGPLVSGGSGAGGHGPGTFDSIGTNVFPNSLYYAQLQDLIAMPYLQTREYRIGGVNLFSSSTPVPLDTTWSNTVKTAAAGLPLDNFDVVANGHWVPFTFNFNLAPNERIVAATLSLSMLAAANNDTNDVLYLDSLTNSFQFSDLGWLPLSTISTNPSVEVLDLSGQLNTLTNGQLNVALQSDAAVDWAVLELKVAPVLATFTNSLAPVADATVHAGFFATNNFGDTATLTANEATLPDNEQKAYLRWDLSSVSGKILQARVHLVPVNVAGPGIEQGATFATTNVWDEAIINWTNQPGGGKRFASWMPSQNVPVEFVIPPQMMDTVVAQGNQLCLQLCSLHNVGVLGSVNYASREYPDPSLRPQLFLIISNTAPSISGLTDLTIFQDTTAGPLSFNASDAESTGGNLMLAATSANPALLPPQNIVFGGSGSNPTVTLTPATGQTGSSLVSIVVTDPGGLTATNQFTLTVAPYTNASFVVSATPGMQSTLAGSGASYDIGITATNGTFTSNVVLNVSGLPAGTTAGFTPPSVTGSGNSTLNISTATNTPGGTYTLTITGTGGGLTRSTTVILSVAGFQLSATPSAQNVSTNGAASFNVAVTDTNGFSDEVDLNVTGLPAGATAGFSPPSLSSSGASILIVTPSPSTPPGIYPLSITAASGSLGQTTAVSLNVFNFSVSAIPGAQTVTTSAGINYTVDVTGTPGISNVVVLGVSGLPAGTTASYLPSSLIGSGETTLSISTTLATPPGNYPLTISAASGNLTNTCTVLMTVTDFGLAVSPATQTVAAGTGTNYTATITATNGFDDEADLEISGLPFGASASFVPPSIVGAGSSTLSLSTATNTPAGTYVLSVSGTDGTLTHNANLTLKIAGFSLASSPSSRTVLSGGTASAFTVTVTETNGFTNAAILTLSGLPSGASASFSTTNLAGSGNSVLTSSLTVSTINSTAAGVYPLTVTATSGNLVYTTIATLKVQDFSIAAAPNSQSVTAGVGTTYAIAVTTNNTFTGVVNLSVSGLPTSTGASFNPASVTNTGVSTLSITTSNTTPGGAYLLTITGTLSGGTLFRTTNVTLNVTGLTNNFALSTTPSLLTVNPGSSNNFTATVGGSPGFTNTVNLALNGVPTGVNAFFNPPAVTNGNGSSFLVIIASNSAAPGIYSLTNIGTSGSLAQTNVFTLNIFKFTLTSTPLSRTVIASAMDHFTIAATNVPPGMTNPIALTVSGLPAGAGAGYSPNPMIVLNTNGTSTLTVTTTPNTPAGNYVLTTTGVFGTFTNTTTCTLKVNDFAIAASPVTQTVAAGSSSTNYSVVVTAINGFNSSVTLIASGLPPGANPVFNPTTITGSGTSLLTITTSGTTPGGTNTISISGINGGQTHSTNVTLIVTTSNTPPVLSSISDRSLNAGVTLLITNVATDSDTPAQTLTFTLLAAPSGASLGTNNGIFTWRAPVARANTTNMTTVKVTDNGTPPMSATQSFNIIVNPMTNPVLAIARAGNGWQLNVSGPAGPDYAFQGASNLVNWNTLATSNSPALPFNWIDSTNVPSRFYRVLLGP